MSSPVDRAFGWFSSLLFPNICQVCHKEPAAPAQGFVGPECSKKGVKMVQPPFCQCCGLPFQGEITHEFTCANCQEEELFFRSARAGAHMHGVMDEVVKKYKYNRCLYFEPFLIEVILQSAQGSISPQNYDAIVPIPMHWFKRYLRQYNQAVRIARALSARTLIPCKTDLLRRLHQTPSQTRLTRKARVENVRSAFTFSGKTALNGERVLLVDDVLTTGATASACAKVLLKNGAGVVDVWTAARGMIHAQTTSEV